MSPDGGDGGKRNGPDPDTVYEEKTTHPPRGPRFEPWTGK